MFLKAPNIISLNKAWLIVAKLGSSGFRGWTDSWDLEEDIWSTKIVSYAWAWYWLITHNVPSKFLNYHEDVNRNDRPFGCAIIYSDIFFTMLIFSKLSQCITQASSFNN